MVVLRNDAEFLLLRRAKPPHPGKYVPVGGKLEPYEDPYRAALRETREETGLALDALQFGGVLVETSPVAYNWQCHIYLADIDRIPPPACDEGELEWIPFDEVLNVPTPPTDWHVYDYMMRRKPFVFNAIYDAELNLSEMIEEIEGKRLSPVVSK